VPFVLLVAHLCRANTYKSISTYLIPRKDLLPYSDLFDR
jgi:hypothetical protein